jgi:hypothetical protein
MKMLRSLLLSALMSLPMSRLRFGETGICYLSRFLCIS